MTTVTPNDDESGEFWQGWPARIGALAWEIVNDVLEADQLASWSFKNRWALNRKKPGPRVLQLNYGQELQMKPGQTLTHYHARRCIRHIQLGKQEAIKGNVDRALMYWAKAETEAERLYGSAVHPLAAKEAKRIRGVKRFGEEACSDTLGRVTKYVGRLPEAKRYERGLPALIADAIGISETQARAHLHRLGYGAKNKKHGA